jgi:hypothetical protein
MDFSIETPEKSAPGAGPPPLPVGRKSNPQTQVGVRTEETLMKDTDLNLPAAHSVSRLERVNAGFIWETIFSELFSDIINDADVHLLSFREQNETGQFSDSRSTQHGHLLGPGQVNSDLRSTRRRHLLVR